MGKNFTFSIYRFTNLFLYISSNNYYLEYKLEKLNEILTIILLSI